MGIDSRRWFGSVDIVAEQPDVAGVVEFRGDFPARDWVGRFMDETRRKYHQQECPVGECGAIPRYLIPVEAIPVGGVVAYGRKFIMIIMLGFQ